MEIVSITERFSCFEEQGRPKVVASLNDHQFKLVKMHGEFPWHAHEHCEVMLFVWRGSLDVEYRHLRKTLDPGQFLIIPKGVEHRMLASEVAEVLTFEPTSTRNSGDVVDPYYTAPIDEEL